jgi:hypothetical protein
LNQALDKVHDGFSEMWFFRSWFLCWSGTHRLGETALHVEGLDLSREAAQQDGLTDGISHQPLWGLWDVLKPRRERVL